MKTYLITYDLKAPGRDYDALYRLLGETWLGERLTESLWLCNLLGPASVVRNCVNSVLDGNDRVAVLEMVPGMEWASTGALPGGVKKMERVTPSSGYLPPRRRPDPRWSVMAG